MTNGNDCAIIDVIMPRDRMYYHRIAADSHNYKSITYSDSTKAVQITNNQYTSIISILKIY